MTGTNPTTFTAEDAIQAIKAMRQALGLGPEQFPLPAFVGMISDEIEQLRQAGRTDAEIAGMVEAATGKAIAPDDLAAFYATPEQRHGG